LNISEDRNSDRLKLTASRYFKSPALSQQRDEAHAELRLLYQSVITSLFQHPSIVNTTPRYFNFSTYCSVLPLTCSIRCLGCL